jgi:hypothetical protein
MKTLSTTTSSQPLWVNEWLLFRPQNSSLLTCIVNKVVKIQSFLTLKKQLYLLLLMEMNMASLFKLSKPRQFNLKPRYWDPVKEERDARARRIAAEAGMEGEEVTYRPYIGRGDFRKGLSRGKRDVKPNHLSSTIRTMAIVLLLTILIYYILQ